MRRHHPGIKAGWLVPIVLTVLVLAVGANAWAQRMSVKVDEANIRSGPGTDTPVLWQVERYHPLEVTQQKGDWVRFSDFEGDTGWISASLLDQTPCVITIKPRCNVRTGPGKQYEVAFTVGPGIPFKIIGKQGNWLNIEHNDGDQGWIYKSLVW